MGDFSLVAIVAPAGKILEIERDAQEKESRYRTEDREKGRRAHLTMSRERKSDYLLFFGI